MKDIMKNITKKGGKFYEKKLAGELKINIETLRKHMLIVGATGRGKSVIIKRIMRQILKRQRLLAEANSPHRAKRKMIIHDVKGDFIEEFYTNDKEWIILNPYDKRGYGFEVLELIHLITDINRVVNSIVPENPNEKDPIWTNMSRAMLKTIFKLCISRKEFKNSDILRYINMGYIKLFREISELEPYINDKGEEKFKRVPKEGLEDAFPFLSGVETTQASNYWSSFTSTVIFFKNFMDSENIINVRDYIREDGRNMILANFPEVEAQIAPILSLFVECAGSEILALEENSDYEIVLILDEFNSLKKMPQVLELLKLARSKGGIVIVGVQELPPIKEKYGEAALSTFKNNTRTKIIFNIGDDETQKVMVNMFGQQELVYSTESNSGGETETKDGFSTSQQRQTRGAVLDSAIASLNDHQFFFIQGISDSKKNYIGKITGMIDPEVDFRDKIAKKVVWRKELTIAAVEERIAEQKKNKGIKLPPKITKEVEEEIETISSDEKEKERIEKREKMMLSLRAAKRRREKEKEALVVSTEDKIEIEDFTPEFEEEEFIPDTDDNDGGNFSL